MSEPGCENMDDDSSQKLIRGFLDGTLDAAGVEQLCQELLKGNVSTSALVQTAMLDETLVNHFRSQREESIRKYLLAFVRLDSDGNPAATQEVRVRDLAAPPIRKSRRWWAAGILAASLLLAAGLYLSRPQDLAMVTQLVGARMS